MTMNEIASSPRSAAESPDLRVDLIGEIFTIRTESATGTGFRGPDGRIVTSFHLINGAREVVAEQDGRQYRLGRNVRIDDINDIAVLGFVDEPPPGSRRLPLATRVKPGESVVSFLSTPAETVNEILRSLSASNLEELNTSVTRVGPQEEVLPGRRRSLSLDSRTLRDALAHAQRPLIELENAPSSSRLGAPLLSESGEVLGLLALKHRGQAYAIPSDQLPALLEQKEGEEKFQITSGAESGIGKWWRDWGRDPSHSLKGTLGPLATALTFAMYAGGAKYTRFAALPLALANGLRTFDDFKGFQGTTNDEDIRYYGTAVGAQGYLWSGIAIGAVFAKTPQLRQLGLAVTALGLIQRLGAEIFPNRYVIKGVERSDGDQRPPFRPITTSMW
jgi:hypothetical protein